MGTGFSVVCASKRSVIISNSLRAIRKDIDIDNDEHIYARQPSKLHPCESRDSGIVENEIPHYLSFSRPDVDGRDDNFQPNAQLERQLTEVSAEYNNEVVKPSRPQSCRLGNRTATQSRNKQSYVEEERLVKLLRQNKTSNEKADSSKAGEEDDLEREDSFYQGYRPESARRGNKRKSASRAVSSKYDGKRSARTISDLDSSTDAEISDSEFWTIPDETDIMIRKQATGNRKGWVNREDRGENDSSGSGTPTPRSGQTLDYYRIVSDSYHRYDANLAKKASERSISSIILMPTDGLNTPTNTESHEPLNFLPLPFYLQRRMDDLVTAFLDALQDRHSKGNLTETEYRNILRNLRYQLVEFVFTCITSDVTPRIEVTYQPEPSDSEANTQALFSDNQWSVQIQLKPSDEEILHTSEKQLAKKLAIKGNKITRDDIVSLLGDHLRTIEQLQHVRDSGRLLTQEAEESNKFTPRQKSAPAMRKTSVTTNAKRKKIPGSPVSQHERVETTVHVKNVSAPTKTKGGNLKTGLVAKERKVASEIKDTPSDYDCESDTTIENTSDTEGNLTPKHCRHPPDTPNSDRSSINSSRSVKKSNSLDERRMKKTLDPHNDISDEEWGLLSDLAYWVWSNRMKATAEELLSELEETRGRIMVSLKPQQNQSLQVPASKDHTALSQEEKANNSPDKVSPRKEKADEDLKELDKEFVKSLKREFQRNALSKKGLEKAIFTHMRKTSKSRVQSINVGPAPLSRTRSLNDAVGEKRNELSANSTISRKSEPDMRNWKNNNYKGEYEDLWDSNERAHSARRNAASRVTTAKRRTGTTQVHGLAPMEPLSEGAEEHNHLPKVEETEGKFSVKSRPDSGIAVSMSSGSYSSYSSSEAAKEADTDDIDEACITESSEMIDRVDKVKPEQHNDIKSLAAAITKGLTTHQLKAYALYCWLGNLNLSKFARTKQKTNSPAGKLKQMNEKKISYAHFYQELCKAAGLKCEKIEGYVKNKDYLPGNTVQSPKFQHTWCAVQMDGHYRLVDPLYGSNREKYFLNHYFMTSPDNFILSHYPKDKKWLLMNQILTIEGFEDIVKTWPAMFHFNIRPLSMKSVIRTYDGKLSITVLLRNVAVIPQLEYAGPEPEIDADALVDNIDEEIRDVENAETFHITLPQEGNYYFTLFAHVLEDELDVPVFQYRIEYIDELL